MGLLAIAACMKDFSQLTRVFTTPKVSVKAQMLARAQGNENENRPRSRTICDTQSHASRILPKK